jgi:transcription elongation factor Elf1
MDNADKIQEATKGFGRNQTLILRSLYLSSLPIKQFSSVKSTVFNLQDRGLIELKDDQVSLTELGQAVCALWQKQNDGKVEILFEMDQEVKDDAPKSRKLRQENLEKSNQFLELCKQGLNRQQIGDRYGISRERVRQILNSNPAFHEYLKEQEKAEEAAEQEKKERAKQEVYSKSLAALYPRRVAELWDYEKNRDLQPEDVSAGSVTQFVWFKCPIDRHSWKKKPGDITNSWDRYGTSGCPICAGKKKKPEKQPSLVDIYPVFIERYWNFEKNSEFGLDLKELTLGSNRKAWFRCPIDGNEWQSQIASTIKQQWSRSNTGCSVCNRTHERKRGEWGKANPIGVEFPEEVAKYWFYEANNELGLDPMKMTIGSSKEAFFKCPIDGHEWVATITSISKGSWKKGNNGCPACRGFITTETTSLLALYPEYVSQYWDYEKNNKLDIFPDKVTKGSQQEAWFKCSHDGYEWKTRIGSITRGSWNLGNNGCARCFGWNLESIRQFVASLESHIPNLTQAELYKIFEQSGVLDTKNIEGLKIVKDIIQGKLTGQKLRDVIQGKKAKTSETETDSIDVLQADTELQIVDASPLLDISDVSQSFELTSNSQDEFDESSKLPHIKVQKSLEFLSSKIVASADQEAVDFFIASRRNRIWAEVFEDESAVEAIEAFTDEGYGRQVRDQFLD